MREIFGPPLRAAALTALIAAIAWLLLRPPSLDGAVGLLTIVVLAAVIIFVTAWITTALAGNEMSESEFRRLAERSDALASLPPADQPPSEFDELVMQALDDLPEEFREDHGLSRSFGRIVWRHAGLGESDPKFAGH